MTGFLSFLVTAAYVPWIAGAATTPRWAVLAIALPWLLGPSRLTAGHLVAILFVLWGALSLTWGVDLYGGAQALAYLLILITAFFVGSSLSDLRPVFIGAACGLGLNGIVAVAQTLGWYGVQSYSISDGLFFASGLFFNPNFLGEAAALVAVWLIVKRAWLFLPVVAPAVFLPGSRTAWVALAIALVVSTRRRVLIAGLVPVIALAGFAMWHFGWRLSSIDERLSIWRDAIDGLTVFGHGLGSFYYQYPAESVRTNTLLIRPDHAHNDLLELVFELGPGALLVLGVGYFAWAYGNDRAGKLVLLAFGIECLAGFPLHNPVTGFLAAVVAGHLCGHGPSVRGLYAIWRSRLQRRYEVRTLRFAAAHRASMAG